ncbi:methyl-accepting chemotaxis protein [Tepidibacter thalassicus]|uniref:Methyl-accepting chemotaxis protein n=1 Tax=Tepidibacter thalassicus DSM 15285 TaxID=1123350 RepID=A0A1M5PNL6_9FIRM|nr:methyl-accepting chemotaxis protein [Tepidibacter thalassicus]SHH03288.1 methyl-accepting chemotaxis protein [Tepidibacter thalassicus DSM 15285]
MVFDKIGNRLVLLCVTLILIPMILVGYFSYNKAAGIITKNMINGNQNFMHQLNKNIELDLRNKYKIFQILHQAVKNIDKSQIIPLFKNFINNNKDIGLVYIGTVDKEMICYPNVTFPDGYDPSKRPWYINALKSKEPVWSKTYVDAVTKKNVITLSAPLYDENNNLKGILAVDIFLDKIKESADGIQLGEGGYIIIGDHEGKAVFHEDKSKIGLDLKKTDWGKQIYKDKKGNIDYIIDGNDKLLTFENNKTIGWELISVIDKSILKEQIGAISHIALLVGFISTLIAIIITILISRGITKPIKEILKTMDEVSKGNFTVQSNVKTKTEIRLISEGLNNMINKIKDLVSNVENISKEVHKLSNDLVNISSKTVISISEVAGAIDEIARGASSQANETDISLSKTKELAEFINTANDLANNMADNSDKVKYSNELGINTISMLKSKNLDTLNIVKNINHQFKELFAKSMEINKITQTITEIAEQTNLLALNATIEAARAGEHGSGFAVVAQEVKKLAEQTTHQAKEIGDLVKKIEIETKETSKVMEKASYIIDDQNSAVEKTEKVFKEIDNVTHSIIKNIVDITKLLENINSNKDEFVNSMEKIASVTEETAASTQQVFASTEQQVSDIERVSDLSKELNRYVDMLSSKIREFTIR